MGEVSEDRLMGGRVVLRQPVVGFRAAIDPVLLAAAVEGEPGQVVLDLGTGTGAAALCLARRIPGIRAVGLDMQRELVRLATDNAILNGLDQHVSFVAGDILAPPPRLAPGSFDHVMANPPYLEAGTGTASPDQARAAAMAEGPANLKAWVRLALAMVRGRGTITFIHRADRLDGLIAELNGRIGDLTICPLWPGENKPAKRIIVRGRRDSRGPARLGPGLLLHGAEGRYSPAAEAILRDGAALAL